MPKSKRNKIVHLTQVKKKGKDHKEDLLKQLEDHFERFAFVYVFDFDQTKSDRIMSLRLKMKPHGCIFGGRNSLVSLALKTIGTKTNTDYTRFLRHITGHRGLLFTSLPNEKLVALLEDGHQEFRDKLVGYAALKTPDDDTVDSDAEEEDDDEGETKAGKKYISLRPIKRVKAKKANKTKATADEKRQDKRRAEAKKQQEETDQGIEVDEDD